jgi:hypothetical protein
VDDQGLRNFARLLRDYHDACAGFSPPPGATWSAGAGSPGDHEVVRHGDFGPWNVVWQDDQPVGIIDWDFARPAPRLHDVEPVRSSPTVLLAACGERNRPSVGSHIRPSDDAVAYLTNKADYLHHDTAPAAGRPIATGIIEGACRHLVKDRLDITGARWGMAGAEAVLKLRALRSNGDFDTYRDWHEQQEFTRNHQTRYRNTLSLTA